MPVAILADDSKNEDKARVKEIDFKDLKFGRPRGRVDRPAVITSLGELEKSVADKEARDRIKMNADFATQKVLYFAWSGSGGDKLTPTINQGDDGEVAVFHYQRGLTKDLRGHVRAFVIPKAMAWRVENKPAR
jgi:hypothetical protein